ncbi:hypothetical protein V8C35DRAFT_215822 [Trichoderma chlorosporum]
MRGEQRLVCASPVEPFIALACGPPTLLFLIYRIFYSGETPLFDPALLISVLVPSFVCVFETSFTKTTISASVLFRYRAVCSETAHSFVRRCRDLTTLRRNTATSLCS